MIAVLAYWPWWGGALAFGVTTVGYFVTVQRPMGVSGAMDRLVHWPSERETERLNAAAADDAAFDAALAAATAAAFGDTLVETLGNDRPPFPPASTPPPSAPAPPPALTLGGQAAFLAAVFVGGLIAAIVNGRFELRMDMGEAFADIVVDGWLMWPTVFVGGILVGVGTRMAGGCSSGHGLSGLGRLQPKSMLAVPVFFGTGVVMSLLLWKVI